MSSRYEKLLKAVGGWRSRHGDRALTFVSLVSALPLAFFAGVYVSQSQQADPIRIEIPAEPTAPAPEVAGVATEVPAPGQPAPTARTDGPCPFVGSRNSDLYHLPSCAPAKRIKPENLVCFSSAEDAAAKGYRPGCIK